MSPPVAPRPAPHTAPRRSSAARAAAITLGAAAAAALWGPSCLLGGFEQVPEPPPPVDPCARIDLPGPPAAESGDAGADIVVVSAIRSIDLGDEPGSAPVGIDLDRSCTCLNEPPTCLPVIPPPPEVDIDPDLGCDSPGGLDNAASALFKAFRDVGGSSNFGSAYFSGLIEQGDYTLLLRVRDYNGQPDDAQVRLDWFASPSFGGTPAWSGTDTWRVMQDGTTNGSVDSPKYTDPQAYVSGGVLVGAFPTVPVKLGESSSTITIKVSGAFVVAELGEVDGMPSVLRGTLVGRWMIPDVFSSLSSYRSPTGIPYCIGSLYYDQTKQHICAAADILAAPGSPTSTCDSLSFGIAFTAYPAQLGVAAQGAPLPGTACPSIADPGTDSCANLIAASQ